MEFIHILILSAIQGITEFLPISSQSHLILTSYLLGLKDQGIGLDIALHSGSLIAILIYYRNEIKKILNTFPLATIVTSGNQGFSANHIPFICEFNLDGTQTILGHIARQNEVFQETTNGSQVLVVFKAEDSYISPNWYPTNKTTHEVVPTWNYQAVHFHGKISFFEDKKSLLSVLGKLTKTDW